jgi:hypothetical protein
MTLGDKQRRFTELVGRLIQFAYSSGFELTFGEAYRTPEQAALNAQKGVGIAKSLHMQRLAIDLMLFIDDVWQTAPEAYKPLGDYWKSLDPLCRWGGDFKMKDAVHFSMEHEGVQ